MTRALSRLCILLIYAASASGYARADQGLEQLLEESAAALHAGQTRAAFDALRQSEVLYAGNPDFDFWFGLTAVRAGEPARASFALERSVAERPEFEPAYLELASAYIQLQQFDAAAEMLAALERLGPAGELRARMEDIRRLLDSRQAGSVGINGYLMAGSGHDNNVGTWPEGLDVLPGVLLDTIDSAYQEVRTGAGHLSRYGKNTFYLGGQAQMRQHNKSDAKQFDQRFLALEGYWKRDIDGARQLVVEADFSELALDGDHYYFHSGVEFALNRLQGSNHKRTIGLQLRHYAFDESLYDYGLTGIYLQRSYDYRAAWFLRWRLSADMELALDERAGGDAWMTGLGVNLARGISPRQRVGLELTYQYAAYLEDYDPYEAINNATARERRDDRASVGLFWDWFPAKSWQVHSSVMYRQQFSSIEAFDYDQISGGVNLTYHF